MILGTGERGRVLVIGVGAGGLAGGAFVGAPCYAHLTNTATLLARKGITDGNARQAAHAEGMGFR